MLYSSLLIRGVKQMRQFKFFVWAVLLGTCLPAFAHAKNSLSDIRMWVSPEKTRIVFDLSSAPTHKIFQLSNPNRLVVDLKQTKRTLNKDELKYDKDLVKNIRFGLLKLSA